MSVLKLFINVLCDPTRAHLLSNHCLLDVKKIKMFIDIPVMEHWLERK